MRIENGKMIFSTVNFCCGIGGQDLGLEQSIHEYKGIQGFFETIAGFDNDPIACKNFERVTGNRAVCVDLFNREQYIMFHGKEPGADWHEMTPEDLRSHCLYRRPDVVIMSTPCKGYSPLLPEKTSQEPKYQALNQLPERVLDLILEAWFDDLPAIFLMENVPGILRRGKKMLARIKAKLVSKGYLFHEDTYDCGVWGGLGQHRVRYLFMARLPEKVPSFVFQPPKLPMKTIGDILGPLPMPGDVKSCGRLHRIPKCAWRTWERLALIPAGKDWRALEKFDRKQWGGAWKIVPWIEPSNAVTAATKGVGISTGVSAVADPRLEFVQGFGSKYRVVSEYESSPAVTGSRVGSGAVLYADPKVPKFAANSIKVNPWDEPSGAVIGGAGLSNGAIAVSDPRLSKRDKRYPGLYKVVPWDDASNTVTGQTDIQSGAISVADPRIDKSYSGHFHCFKATPFDKSSDTVTSGHGPTSGCISVADPRISEKWSGAGNYGVMKWDEPAKTITATGDIHSGTSAVADPRIPDPDERGIFIIIAADGTWHRPITTFEGAMLQGFPSRLKDGSPFDLVDCSDGKAREYIGNAVPVQTATAIGNALLATLMPNYMGDWHWGFSDDLIWVSTYRSNSIQVNSYNADREGQ